MLASFFSRLFRWHRPGSPEGVQWEQAFHDRSLVPVWADWVGGFGLTAGHEVVFIQHVSGAAPEAVEEPHLRNVTLFQASRRYPELAALAPERLPGDPTCPSCGGTGVFRRPDGRPLAENVVCFCGGMGWLPAGYDAASPRQAG
jgi:hypothetical protein